MYHTMAGKECKGDMLVDVNRKSIWSQRIGMWFVLSYDDCKNPALERAVLSLNRQGLYFYILFCSVGNGIVLLALRILLISNLIHSESAKAMTNNKLKMTMVRL